jgi:hypothetical protein
VYQKKETSKVRPLGGVTAMLVTERIIHDLRAFLAPTRYSASASPPFFLPPRILRMGTNDVCTSNSESGPDQFSSAQFLFHT